MMNEDRLRGLLRDPGWSLPAWPDAQARVRRAARRQRLARARLSSAVAAVVTMAVAVPVLALGGPAASPAGGPPQGLAIPAVGASGFPVSIYPAASVARVPSAMLAMCPAPDGLRTPGLDTTIVAVTSLSKLGHGFGADLHASDRAFWGQVVAAQRAHESPVTAAQPVLYSGPLSSFQRSAVLPPQPLSVQPVQGRVQALRSPVRPVPGPVRPVHGPVRPVHGPVRPVQAVQARVQELQGIVTAGCGAGLVRHTWVVLSGYAAAPALAAETLFLNRRGRLLVYNSA